MKKLIKLAFLVTIAFFYGAYADSNGIWTYPRDVTPGIFGADESSNLSQNYTFNHEVYFNSNIKLDKIESSNNPSFKLDFENESTFFILRSDVYYSRNSNQYYLDPKDSSNLNFVDVSNLSIDGVPVIDFIESNIDLDEIMGSSNFSTNLWELDSSGNMYTLDKVGIGTEPVGAKLRVGGNVIIENRLGINTSPNPNFRLNINGQARTTSGWKVKSDNGESKLTSTDLTIQADSPSHEPEIILGDTGYNWHIAKSNLNRFEIRGDNEVPKVSISTSGDIGIGTTTPGAKLRVAGNTIIDNRVGINTNPNSNFRLNINGRGRATGWQTTSDERLKSNIYDSVEGLNSVLKLEPKRYDLHNYSFDEEGNLVLGDGIKTSYGFIAQDLNMVLPLVVEKPIDSNDIWTVDYNQLNAILVKAIQELKEEKDNEIDELKKRIEELEEK